MPKMHQNTFGGGLRPDPLESAEAPPDSLATIKGLCTSLGCILSEIMNVCLSVCVCLSVRMSVRGLLSPHLPIPILAMAAGCAIQS